MAAPKQKKRTTTRKRRERKNIERGQVHIHSSFNGLIYSIYPKEAVRVLVKGILLIVNHFTFYH